MDSIKDTCIEISDISPKTTALLIIDMQNDVMNMVPPGRQVIPVIKQVLDACRNKGISVIHKVRIQRPDGIDVERFRVEMFKNKPYLVEGTPGAEIVPELKPAKGEFQVKGARFSGFFQTDMQLVLTRLGVKNLVICGVQTPNCIRSTVTDAIGYDYDVILLKNAIAAQTEQVHEANLFDMKNMGVTIILSDEFLGMI
ncbi:MAG: isochorismatase family cysteine hydrolase [Desulfobacterales bacterium]